MVGFVVPAVATAVMAVVVQMLVQQQRQHPKRNMEKKQHFFDDNNNKILNHVLNIRKISSSSSYIHFRLLQQHLYNYVAKDDDEKKTTF